MTELMADGTVSFRMEHSDECDCSRCEREEEQAKAVIAASIADLKDIETDSENPEVMDKYAVSPWA